jgi:hypothetical protein
VRIERLDSETIRLSRIDGFLADILRRILPAADATGSEAAEARLFSTPVADPDEADFVEDWRELVEPELRKLFQSALDVIAGDLAGMKQDENGEAAFTVAVSHLEKWIHGLNQARLALVARHDFKESDMDRTAPILGDERTFALLQVRFYGILEEWFLNELDPLP